MMAKDCGGILNGIAFGESPTYFRLDWECKCPQIPWLQAVAVFLILGALAAQHTLKCRGTFLVLKSSGLLRSVC